MESLRLLGWGDDNLVVLRTLSKAHALAGARCGAAIAAEGIVDIRGRVLPPYSFATPVTETILEALSPDRLRRSAENVRRIVGERDRLAIRLGDFDGVGRVFPSHANFLLVDVPDAAGLVDYLASKRILVRYFGAIDGLRNRIRITIGTREENDRLLEALADFRGSSA